VLLYTVLLFSVPLFTLLPFTVLPLRNPLGRWIGRPFVSRLDQSLHLRRRVSFSVLLRAGLLPAALALGSLLLGGLPARAEGVLERVARTGELVLTGYADLPPLLTLRAKGQPQGYAVEVADRVAAELSAALGRPVKLRFVPATDPVALETAIASGKADLACGLPFSWERDMRLDHSLAIGLSGLRLLTTTASGIDGSAASLAGRPIGVVRGSLAEGELLGIQPQARAVPFNSLQDSLAAFQAGRVQGILSDTIVLAGLAQSRGIQGALLVPELPYEVYGVSCVLPPDASTYRHLVNLAIVRLLQGYLDGEPGAVQAVNRWLGPGSSIGIPQPRLQAIFEGVLIGVEAIRPVPQANP
jgi:polar amino acid transport system substrate-binding protein